MASSFEIKSVLPDNVIPGGELLIATRGLSTGYGRLRCVIGDQEARITAASSRRVITVVPEGPEGETDVKLVSEGETSSAIQVSIGRVIARDLHIVANPAVDPLTGIIYTTRSGPRGQQLPATLFRIEPEGYIEELPAAILNPTGLAFDPRGGLFVTNRAEGTVCRVDYGEEVAIYASELGIATGIAFDDEGVMYVGDRTGRIFKIREFGRVSEFARIEPSVAAHHLAFGPDGRLYVSAPGLSSYDNIYAIDRDGKVSIFFRGFGRPQGLAFDGDGNLYVAACYEGRHGIVKIPEDKSIVEHFLSGGNIVGLCFKKGGELVVATNSSLFEFDLSIKGLLPKDL
jgi:sugar lactone lactonase YvrE